MIRVGASFTQQQFLSNLSRLGANLQDILARMSSGNRVNLPSDDPRAAAELLRLEDQFQLYALRMRGIGQSRPWLNGTEAALNELGDKLVDAQSKAIQGASDTVGAAGRESIANEIAEIREFIEGLANTKVSGQYIFSGTLHDQPPYDAAGAYQGNSDSIEIPLDEGLVELNLPGSQVFGEVGVGGPLDLLDRLETALRLDDASAIQATLDDFDQAIDANSVALSRIGGRQQRLDAAVSRLEALQFEIARRSEELGADDLAATITELQQLEVGYQATLQAGARLFGPTFFDYLG